MQTCALGRLLASRVGLGCNNFGKRLDEVATREVVQVSAEELRDIDGLTLPGSQRAAAS